MATTVTKKERTRCFSSSFCMIHPTLTYFCLIQIVLLFNNLILAIIQCLNALADAIATMLPINQQQPYRAVLDFSRLSDSTDDASEMTTSSAVKKTTSKPATESIAADFIALKSTTTDVIALGTGPIFRDPYLYGHKAFEKLARDIPDLIAIEHEANHISYANLDDKASILSTNLINQYDISTGAFVAIISPASIDMITAILAILKSSAAFVPIDSILPPIRINFILKSAQCKLVLYHEDFDYRKVIDDALCASSTVRFVPLSFKALFQPAAIIPLNVLSTNAMMNSSYTLAHHDSPALPLSLGNAHKALAPNDPAYAIFTSGSTGNPKGVVISHASLSNFANALPNILNTIKGDRVAQLASPSFDMFVAEIFCTLSKGGALVLRPPKDPLSITRYVDIILGTPTLLSKLDPEKCQNLKRVVLGGESLPPALASRWMTRTMLMNAYGPTEITMASCMSHVNRTDHVGIGKSLSNYVSYIVTSDLKLADIGADGELMVGGAGVAIGYLGRDDLTAERFILDPFLNDGSRMYRTGDICRWNEINEIQFLGRVDDMVKVKGYRIELEEVRKALASFQGTRDAVALAFENKLYSFLSPKDIDTIQLRDHVSRLLPHYMCPSIHITLDDLPFTTSNKVDKRMLLDMIADRKDLKISIPQSVAISPMSPLSPTESKVRDIWAKVLNCDAAIVSPETSFFELGGDSVNSVALLESLAQFETPAAQDLSLSSIYKHQTLRSLSQKIDGRGNTATMLSIDWSKEISYEESWVLNDPKTLPPPIDSAAIVLTGVTGFLGCQLLHDLLRTTNPTKRIICLAVRAKSDDDAVQRVLASLIRYKLFTNFVRDCFASSRILVHHGNLDEDRLGLDDETFLRIQKSAGLIYHSGACVNHLHSYSNLKASNISSLKWIVHLATGYTLKPIQFISTLGVWELAPHDSAAPTEFGIENLVFDIEPDKDPNTPGYAASKWVAEMKLAEYTLRGGKVNIFRPSYVTGHTKKGVGNQNGSIDLLLSVSVALNVFPTLPAKYVDIIPVDYASKLIINLSREAPESNLNVFHVSNPNPTSWSKLYEKLSRKHHSLKLVDVNAFSRSLASSHPAELDSKIKAVQALLQYDAESFKKPFVSAARGYGRIGRGTRCPKVTSSLLGVYYQNDWKMSCS